MMVMNDPVDILRLVFFPGVEHHSAGLQQTPMLLQPLAFRAFSCNFLLLYVIYDKSTRSVHHVYFQFASV